MEYHPEALKFPKVEGEQREAIKASIKRTGGNKAQPILYRVVEDRWQGLDGRTREELCNELGITPTYKKVKVDDQEVKYFIWQCNLCRRHMTPEQRKPFIEDMKANGFSNREIARTIGISASTVARDMKSDPPESSGKSRVTAPNGAKNTKDSDNVSKADSAEKSKSLPGFSIDDEEPKNGTPEPPKPVVDELGQPVPPGLLGVFSRVAQFDKINSLLNECVRIAKELVESPASTRFTQNDFSRFEVDIKNAKGNIKHNAPHSVCPACHGNAKERKAKCPCSGLGWLSVSAYRVLPPEYKQ